MRNILRVGRGISLLAFLFALACAGQQKPVTIERGERILQLKASDSKFEPNDLRTHQGDLLTIHVENVSGTARNLTVKDPQGNVLTEVDIPPRGPATAKVRLAETGTYPFYCNKTMHSTLSMKGKIEVSPK